MENPRKAPAVNSTTLAPPDGYYAAWSPDGAPQLTCWQLQGRTVQPWPVNSRYGPVRPAYDPDLDPQVRRIRTQAYKSAQRAYLAAVYDAISADPAGAARLFTRITGRCRSCKAILTVEDLQPDTPADSARAATERIVAAALHGFVDEVGPLLGDADPRAVITRLSAVVSTLAGVR